MSKVLAGIGLVGLVFGLVLAFSGGGLHLLATTEPPNVSAHFTTTQTAATSSGTTVTLTDASMFYPSDGDFSAKVTWGLQAATPYTAYATGFVTTYTYPPVSATTTYTITETDTLDSGDSNLNSTYSQAVTISPLSTPPPAPTYNIGVNATCGTVTFDGVSISPPTTIQEPGGTYTISGSLCKGYAFDEWTAAKGVTLDGATELDTEATVTNNGSLSLVLTKETYSVAIMTSPTTCGSVTFDGTSYTNGGTATVAYGVYSASASACTGYSLSSLVGGGGVAGNDGSYGVTGNGTLTATFAGSGPGSYTVSFATTPSTCGAVVFDGSPYGNGAHASVVKGTYSASSVACAGYSPSTVSGSGDVSVSGGEATVSGNGTITATFSVNATPDTVSFVTSPSTCGSIQFNGVSYSNGGSVAVVGGSYAVGTTACSGYVIESLTSTGGVGLSGSTAIVTSAGTITATFSEKPGNSVLTPGFTFNRTGLAVTLHDTTKEVNITGLSLSVNWGDTGSSSTVTVGGSVSHTYAKAGNYTVVETATGTGTFNDTVSTVTKTATLTIPVSTGSSGGGSTTSTGKATSSTSFVWDAVSGLFIAGFGAMFVAAVLPGISKNYIFIGAAAGVGAAVGVVSGWVVGGTGYL